MGPRAGQAVLQLHPALNLLHRGHAPRQCTGCSLGTAYAVPHNGKGNIRALPAWRRPAFSRPKCLTPDRPITDIFNLTENISRRGRGRKRKGRRGRPQETASWRRGGQGGRKKKQGRIGKDERHGGVEGRDDRGDRDDSDSERMAGTIRRPAGAQNERQSRGGVPRGR